jgi:pimeloyl-ACP methyl ester carboxylesterase
VGEISPGLFRAGEGEPLVLVHGASGSWHHWRPVLADLVARFEVIAPTLPGHFGGPPYPDHFPSSIVGAADAFERQLDELGVERAHMAGNSLGGALSIEMAKRGRTRSVVALSPAGGWELDSKQGKRVARFFARTGRMAQLSLPIIRPLTATGISRRIGFFEVMRRGNLLTPDDAEALTRATANCTVMPRVIEALEQGDSVMPMELDTIRVPVLLAWGDKDRVVPSAACASRFRREIPEAEFRVLHNVGHVPAWDAPQLVVDTIVDWIGRHGDA